MSTTTYSRERAEDNQVPRKESLPATPEPFVSADEAAQFLCVKRRYVLELARRGIAGAYALGTGSKRKIWVFRLSELAASIVRNENASPKSVKSVYDRIWQSPLKRGIWLISEDHSRKYAARKEKPGCSDTGYRVRTGGGSNTTLPLDLSGNFQRTRTHGVRWTGSES